ncbi:glycoside hydrolase family 9 protein [Porifericola rhodea]|uniref:glycoside hydrolase family 9 protein n=1 Tax=Porifericola rhodea TaxID=930972 RepID=UPI0026669ED7|nr:glycoside hydrolase family 9 protein [Porifericola rhodea]WKN31109.1 glycoside hydrolase family 9 protein [Porifericola rhodea]
MPKTISTFFCALLLLVNAQLYAQSWIRINQLGYLPEAKKVAVLVSKDLLELNTFALYDAMTDEEVWRSGDITSYGAYAAFKSGHRLNFSDFKQVGAYYIKSADAQSPVFHIAYDVYDGTADFLLNYMRQQRCGYNPFLKDSCHFQDGFRVYHPSADSTYVNVRGGWHDATDYLQYTATSSNAVYQMLLAYQQNPDSFVDEYDAVGHKGSNGVADVLDEARWGLDWLLKMNPAPGEMYNQIADDRDHAGYRLPNHDEVSYGKGKERPVYFITGKPQGLKYKNRATGVASTAGKFASAFALAAQIFEDDTAFSSLLQQKARDAFAFGESKPGVSQTAPGNAPYFYEEDNWVDDMELAAAELYHLSHEPKWLDKGVSYGKREVSTPWMGADTARHYQWYPFWNVGHPKLSMSQQEGVETAFQEKMKVGLQKILDRGKNNPFLMGVPFIWCSNNLVTAAASQAHLYKQISGDTQFAEMEAALRDWLLGCNPWGVSMIVGLPEHGNYPRNPHSSLTYLKGYHLSGGLVDGPVYGSIFNNLKGLLLVNEDMYAKFQSDLVVYHDDFGDYSTNEPTMDGTASLVYLLSALQKEGQRTRPAGKLNYHFGAINRTDSTQMQINLMFSAHEYADGYLPIKEALDKHEVKASFFFTGDFYREPDHHSIIKQLIEDGHYLGAHSDQHLLYASWEKRDSLLVGCADFNADVENNYREMKNFGIERKDALFYLPPYEWYNDTIAAWTKHLGLKLINFTPGTLSNQDWTYPELKSKYLTSGQLMQNILEKSVEKPSGLNGFNLLIHFGTDPRRTDKLYLYLDEIISRLKAQGYSFTRIDQTAL